MHEGACATYLDQFDHVDYSKSLVHKKSEDFSSLLLSDHNFNENYVSQR